MGASEIINLLKDEDNNLNLGVAIEAIQEATSALVTEGAALSGNAALDLFSKRLDYAITTLAQLVVGTQASVVAADRGLDQLITGAASQIPEYDADVELATLLANIQLRFSAETLDALEASRGASTEAALSDALDEAVALEDRVHGA